MPAYRLYHLDGTGRVDSAEWLEAADDTAATAQALEIPKRAVTAELWQGERRIACLNSGGLIFAGD